MAIDHLTESSEAIDYLAESLVEGTVALFLGAGASIGSGLPGWSTLIQRLQARSGLSTDAITDDQPAEALQRAADQAKARLGGDDQKFAECVREVLYDGVQLGPKLLQSDLLTAVGALLAGSRRGHVSRVITLNFDCVLEWYLSLYGLVSKVIVQPRSLEGAEDVRIYHPHGFLPHPDLNLNSSDFVILGLEGINFRLGTRDAWFELMSHIMSTSVCLFVGMSFRTFEDRAIGPLIEATKAHLRASGEKRPTGFWLCGDSSNSAPGATPTIDDISAQFLRANVVPIFWQSPAEVPQFLFSICQRAAKSF